jgi:hypothetical protein
MIKRSELQKYIADPTLLSIPANSKFFYSEVEAYNYKKSLGNVVSKIDHWHLKLDDLTETEAQEIALNTEDEIEKIKQNQLKENGKVLINDAQINLIRSYSTSLDIYTVSVVSELTPKEFYKRGIDIMVFDDEVNGATRAVEGVDYIKKDDLEDQV